MKPRSAMNLTLAATIVLTSCAGFGGRDDARDAEADAPDAPSPRVRVEIGDDARQSLSDALDAYEQVREELAADRIERLGPLAQALGDRLADALVKLGAGRVDRVDLTRAVREARAESDALSSSADLAAAREHFARLSRNVIAIGEMEPELARGWNIFVCPMADEWIQRADTPANPYMGQAMPTCATPGEWSSAADPESSGSADPAIERPDEIAYWTCAMHPSVKSAEPGNCPICSMTLHPVTRGEAASGVIEVDAGRRQAIGVKTSPVERRALTVRIRAVGRVTYDETRLSDVSVKYRGWIGDLRVDTTGQLVREGEPLFTLYSPELYAAQEELLTALASQRAARETSAPHRADYLVDASHKRLRLWDLTDGQIDEIVRTGEPMKYVPILSPVTGYIVEKNVVAGSFVEPGLKLYRIAGLDRVWVEAEVYESELPLVGVGQDASVTLPYLPGERFAGRVSFVFPYLDAATRTGRVRVELPNPGLALKPDMYADVEIVRDLGERLVVPEQAVLYAGERTFAFVDLGAGRLMPREIRLGTRDDDAFEVLDGLEEGDVIVTSGNFLIAAESRLKLAMEQWK